MDINIDYDLIVSYLWDNVTFELFLKFVIVYFFIIWIALIVRVIKDIWNRTQSLILQFLCVLIIVFWTPFGIIIYLMVRPSKTLTEKYYEEIEDNLEVVRNIIEEKNMKEEETLHCCVCNYPVSPDFKFCPNCSTTLKKECENCKKIINIAWKNCPYCWVEINKDYVKKQILKKPKMKSFVLARKEKKVAEKEGDKDVLVNVAWEFEKNNK